MTLLTNLRQRIREWRRRDWSRLELLRVVAK